MTVPFTGSKYDVGRMKYFREEITSNTVNNGCARPGVAAGKAAGMHVIAVPSVPKNTAEFSSADEVIDSLLDVRPEKWGLPPFNDCMFQLLSLSITFVHSENICILLAYL